MNRTPDDPFAPLPPGGVPPATAEARDFSAELPAPAALPDIIRHGRLGVASQVWRYCGADGAMRFAVCRFDGADGKEVLPLTYGTLGSRRGWHWKAPPAPRPLYRLDHLAARPDAPVIVTEGEKAADAAARLFTDHVATTSPSGAQAARLADWSALRGRDVLLWPDADAPGRAYAAEAAELIRRTGARSVRIVPVPDDWPPGWDLADAPPPGIDPAALRALLAAGAASDPPQLVPAPMPPGFIERPAGIFARDDDADRPDLHVSGPLHVVANTHDGTGEDWGVLLSWLDNDGRLHEWAMPRALLAGEATEVRARLLRGGLFVSTARKAREALATYLMRARPVAHVRIVGRLGWHTMPAGPVFVLPKQTIAPPGAETVRLQTEHATALPPVDELGTLAAWQQGVAQPAIGNSRLALALSMAFAAPLLGIVGAEGGGVHLRGRSSAGKSTAAIAAGSVWGGGGLRGWLHPWRATGNGLEGLAAGHCDLLLTLDEIAEVDERHLGIAAYQLANGGGKVRATRDGGARKSAEWRLLFLSSGEVSIADRLAEGAPGRRQAAGQEVRVVDLPADAGAGLGLFETLHGAARGGAFAEQVKVAARAHYGTAGPAFLRQVVADSEAAAEAVRRFRHAFLESQVPPDADGQVRRVADRFALIAAGGELARAFGILPWPEGEAARAAARCFADWRRARGGDGPAELRDGIAQVRLFLERHGEGRFRRLGIDAASDVAEGPERPVSAGFRRETPEGTEYFILPGIWRAEVAAGFDAGALAAEMVRLGYLRADPGDGKPACRVSIKGRTKGARVYHVLPALFADGAGE